MKLKSSQSEFSESIRAALLLAASSLNDRALRSFVQLVTEIGPHASLDLIKSLRQRVSTNVVTSDFRSLFEAATPPDHAIAEVSRLLIRESQLKPQAAAELLTASIKESRPGSVDLPLFRPKEGFEKWLDRISVDVSASDLLHHAVKIRNRAVHSVTESQWPLRTRTKK